MRKVLKGLLLILPLAVTLAGHSLPLYAATTKHFDIYQNGSSGCRVVANCFNGTSPGPDIMVNQGDLVSIKVHNNDTIAHTFTITTAPYTSVDTGQMSPSQVITLPTFTASMSGLNFHYQCTNHPIDMLGTFKVMAVSAVSPSILLALLGTTTAAAFITMRKRR